MRLRNGPGWWVVVEGDFLLALERGRCGLAQAGL